MPKTNAETMTVRLPTQIANELIKLRDEKNLPTIGSALQIYVQKMKEDRLQEQMQTLTKRLIHLEAYQLVDRVIIFIERANPGGKLGDPLNVAPYFRQGILNDLRKAKRNFEEINERSCSYYKVCCVHLYIYGDQSEDLSPKMKRAFDEFVKETAAIKKAKE